MSAGGSKVRGGSKDPGQRPTWLGGRHVRASLADPVGFEELSVGRLGPETLQRLFTSRSLHHRTGPWTVCAEDFSRVLRTGSDLERTTITVLVPLSAPCEAPGLAVFAHS